MITYLNFKITHKVLKSGPSLDNQGLVIKMVAPSAFHECFFLSYNIPMWGNQYKVFIISVVCSKCKEQLVLGPPFNQRSWAETLKAHAIKVTEVEPIFFVFELNGVKINLQLSFLVGWIFLIAEYSRALFMGSSFITKNEFTFMKL